MCKKLAHFHHILKGVKQISVSLYGDDTYFLYLTDGMQESSTEVAVDSSLSVKWNDHVETTNKEPERTLETTSQQAAPIETFHSFHIANIVPDLFKNHEDSSNKTTFTEGENCSTKSDTEISDKSQESNMAVGVENLDQDSTKLEGGHSPSKEINLDEPLEKEDIETPVDTPVFDFHDMEAVKLPSSLEFMAEETLSSKEVKDDNVFDDRMPLLSPDKPLAVSLVELDHSYGLVAPALAASVEEPSLFDNNSKEPAVAAERELTESPVVDVVTVESVLLPVPDLTPPKPQFPVRSFEADDELVYEFHRLGIDAEDCHYMKVGFEQLQQVGSESVVNAHWSSHPHILFH